ncbi:MAG: prepilin-type N-terminal cleavage/methylation domain-containing protein [Verrucomicrobiales bacterium]|nr:prepilin-type N-terminal cleavage/methylation domain-containing protein [Verrucomicrobiales bacterium]
MRPLRSSPSQPPGGFTLIEVILALAIAAVVLVAVNGLFYSALRLRERSIESFEAAQPLQRALTIIQRDLANLVPPGGTLGGVLQTTPTNTAVRPGLASPEFRTATGRIDDTTPWAEVQKVSYLLTDATSSSTNRGQGRALVRSVVRNLLPSGMDEFNDEWLMDGVDSLTFSFYDGTQWWTTWDSSSQTPALPRAIRVELQPSATTRYGDLPEPVELVVPILVEAQTNQTSQSSADGGSAGGAP